MSQARLLLRIPILVLLIGGKIEDFDTDEDNGVLIYDIEKKVNSVEYGIEVTADGVILDIDSESDVVIIEGELTEKSETPTLKNIAPYSEALVVYKYGVCKHTIGHPRETGSAFPIGLYTTIKRRRS